MGVNVWLQIRWYPLVSAASRYFAESRHTRSVDISVVPTPVYMTYLSGNSPGGEGGVAFGGSMFLRNVWLQIRGYPLVSACGR